MLPGGNNSMCGSVFGMGFTLCRKADAMKRLALFLALFLTCPMPLAAGFSEGLRTYEIGDYAMAFKEFRPMEAPGQRR
jgi:hypothetical protein